MTTSSQIAILFTQRGDTNRQKSGFNEGWFPSNAGARKITIVEEEWLAQAKEVHDDMQAAMLGAFLKVQPKL